MRLRLSVQRNNLPATNILWSVPDTNSPQAYTIARLLEDVNRVLPLEAEQWGLEDYTVEVDGFECLHFSAVSQTLKEDDHVSIRPLLTAEVRSRTLCGRYQISEGGQHLVDGIPFGRPYLRQPNRPAVRIPPRKRRRLEEDDTVAGSEENGVAGLITASGEASPRLNGSAVVDGIAGKRSQQSRSRKSGKTVHFGEVNVDDSDDSEDDEEFTPSGESEDSDSSMEDDSDADSDDTSDLSDTSSAASSTSSSDSDSDSSASESEADAAVSSASDVLPSETKVLPKAPPGEGSKVTKGRNKRRQEAKRLKQLKEIGELDQSATLEDLRKYQEEQKMSPKPTEDTPRKPVPTHTGKRKRLDRDGEEEAALDETAELQRRKQEFMAKIAEATPTAATGNAAPSSESPWVETPKPKTPMTEKRKVGETSKVATPPEPPSKRLRPDTAAIGRILTRQARTVEKKSPKAKPPPAAEEPPEPEGASDPDFWKSRINLSAFECWNEQHELSAPSFPFKQHWDPASKLMREKTHKKRKRGANTNSARNSVGTDEDTETLILNYDDSPETAKADSDPTAAIESQLLQDAQIAARSDLPPLPEDVDVLRSLERADIKVGAIIAFKLLVLNPNTRAPEFSGYKTAIVEEEGDSGNGAGVFKLKLAERDIARREKADEPIDDMEMNDEEDASAWQGTFQELVSPKLLQAAE